MHFYQFNIGDYLSHTRHLSPMQDLAYRRLLDLYYLHERPISGTLKEIARRVLLAGHEDDIEAVLIEFFPKDADGSYCNARADAEILGYKAMREGGKRGAMKRWPKDSVPNSQPIAPLQAPQSQGESQLSHPLMLNNKHETINNKQYPPQGNNNPTLQPITLDWQPEHAELMAIADNLGVKPTDLSNMITAFAAHYCGTSHASPAAKFQKWCAKELEYLHQNRKK